MRVDGVVNPSTTNQWESSAGSMKWANTSRGPPGQHAANAETCRRLIFTSRRRLCWQLLRRRDGEVGHRVLTLKEVLVVLGVVLRGFDVVSGERVDLVKIGPPAQSDQLTASIAKITCQQLRCGVAGSAAVAAHPGPFHDVDVLREPLGAHQASPHPRDHRAAWNA
jgi:hypothetical protein